MGYKKPERRSIADLIHPHVSIGTMRRQRDWILRARCRRCHIELLIDLDTMIRLNGDGFKPWNRSTRCRRVGCGGRCIFLASPPGWHQMFWPLGGVTDDDPNAQTPQPPPT